MFIYKVMEDLKAMTDSNLNPQATVHRAALIRAIGQVPINLSLFLRSELDNLNDLAGWDAGSIHTIEIRKTKVFFKIGNQQKENRIMDNLDEFGIAVDVSIGQVNMSLADLLEMERGECIVSKLKPTSSVALMIAGELVANASFEIEGEMIVLKINEIFLDGATDPSDNVMDGEK